MSVSSQRLIILDPSLKDLRGHHYSLTKAITLGAENNNIDVIWYVNKEFQNSIDSDDVKVRRIFKSSMYDLFIKQSSIGNKPLSVDRTTIDRIPKYARKILKKIFTKFKAFIPNKYRDVLGVGESEKEGVSGFVGELVQAFEQDDISDRDVVLVHTADGMIYRSMLDMVVNYSNFSKFPSFHLCTPYDSQIMPHNNRGMRVKDVVRYVDLLGVLNNKIFLYAENELLSEHLSEEWGVEVETLEIPPPLLESTVAVNDSTLDVVYLGAAREEKGFHLLPGVIDHILSKDEGDELKIRMRLQCTPQVIGYVPAIKNIVERLNQYKNDRVSLIDQQQSMNQYYRALQEADVVLLCYDSEKYRVRGSGIAAEAVTYGKIVVATPNTFPSFLAGKAGVLASTEVEIAEAILKVAANKGIYKSAAIERSIEYRKKVTAGKYVKHLFERLSASERTKQCAGDLENLERATCCNQSLKNDEESLFWQESELNKKIEDALVIGEDGVKIPRLIKLKNSISEG